MDRRQKTVAQNSFTDTLKVNHDSSYVTPVVQSDTDTTILHIDTAKIKGNTYIAFYKTDTLYVVNNGGDTIIRTPDLHPNFEFNDFNEDGCKDIRIHYLGNVPAVQDLLLFDKTKKSFKLVEDFSRFPDPNPIKGTKFFYSYHRSGCADMNWGSDLFYLDNFKAIRIGNISGYECENRDTTDGVYIYKVKGSKKTSVVTMPITTIQKYDEYKWGFIKEYWTKNYRKFL